VEVQLALGSQPPLWIVHELIAAQLVPLPE
jgi:hypothetical protein